MQSYITIAFCRAFNEKYGYKIKKLECYEDEIKKYVKLPVISDGKGDVILDSEGREIMSVRGYGVLQYKGEDYAVKMQMEIGNMFAEAFNKKYPVKD